MLLPHEWATTDNTADDILHKDIVIDRLRSNKVGWPRDEFDTTCRVFVNRMKTTFVPLTSYMVVATSDAHNASS